MQEIEFEGIKIQVQRRLFQRSLNLLVKPSGQVKITSGKTTSLRHLVQFLETQKDWLLKNVNKIRDEKNKYPAKEYVEGEQYLFLGRKLPLVFKHHDKKRLKAQVSADSIILFMNEKLSFTKEEKRIALNKFYKASGVEVLGKVIKEKSKIMNLHPSKVSYRAQKTRWGSCSSQGSLSMNWKLIFSPPDSLEYVVIHELAHLQFQDHSKNFWSLVEEYSPDYKVHSDWLKENMYEIDSYQFK